MLEGRIKPEYGVEECSGDGILAAAHSSGLVFLAEHWIKSCCWCVHAALFLEAFLVCLLINLMPLFCFVLYQEVLAGVWACAEASACPSHLHCWDHSAPPKSSRSLSKGGLETPSTGVKYQLFPWACCRSSTEMSPEHICVLGTKVSPRARGCHREC